MMEQRSHAHKGSRGGRALRVLLLIGALLSGGSALRAAQSSEAGAGGVVHARLISSAVLPRPSEEPDPCSTDIMNQGDRNRAALLRSGGGVTDLLIATAGFAQSPTDAADALGIEGPPRPRSPLGFSRFFGGVAARRADCTSD